VTPGVPRAARTARPYAAQVLAIALASVLATPGCGGGSEEAALRPAPSESPVDPATAGRMTGRVTLRGAPPAAEVINRRSDPYCDELGEARTERYEVSADGGLQNVFVYVKDGLGDLRFPIPAGPVVLDQDGCTYVPRVLGIQVGQSLEILNSDDTLHNVHAAPEVNREFNHGQGQQGLRHTHVFTAPEVMVPFQCDVHNWMHAWVGVLEHPFHAVSAAAGTFSIEGLPPGSYTIEAWHEALGAQAHTVTIAPAGEAEASFTFTM
jgi:hypothetical protein